MNTVKTFMLMAALTALFMAAGQAMGGQQGMTIALVLALGLNFFAYWNSDKMALAMNRAREVSVAEAPDLHALVASLAGRAGIPKPKVYVVDDPTPNAFATGRQTYDSGRYDNTVFPQQAPAGFPESPVAAMLVPARR